MRGAGLTGASRRRRGVTTTRRDKDARPAPDLVDRDPDKLWVADMALVQFGGVPFFPHAEGLKAVRWLGS
jgi:hypothetical protein